MTLHFHDTVQKRRTGQLCLTDTNGSPVCREEDEGQHFHPRGKGEETIKQRQNGCCTQRTWKGQCSRGDRSINSDPNKKENGQEEDADLLPKREDTKGDGKGDTTRKGPQSASPSGKSNKPVCTHHQMEQGRLRDIPVDVLEFIPQRELKLDAKIFAECLRKRTNRMFSWTSVPTEALALLTVAAEDFARQ